MLVVGARTLAQIRRISALDHHEVGAEPRDLHPPDRVAGVRCAAAASAPGTRSAAARRPARASARASTRVGPVASSWRRSPRRPCWRTLVCSAVSGSCQTQRQPPRRRRTSSPAAINTVDKRAQDPATALRADGRGRERRHDLPAQRRPGAAERARTRRRSTGPRTVISSGSLVLRPAAARRATSAAATAQPQSRLHSTHEPIGTWPPATSSVQNQTLCGRSSPNARASTSPTTSSGTQRQRPPAPATPPRQPQIRRQRPEPQVRRGDDERRGVGVADPQRAGDRDGRQADGDHRARPRRAPACAPAPRRWRAAAPAARPASRARRRAGSPRSADDRAAPSSSARGAGSAPPAPRRSARRAPAAPRTGRPAGTARRRPASTRPTARAARGGGAAARARRCPPAAAAAAATRPAAAPPSPAAPCRG